MTDSEFETQARDCIEIQSHLSSCLYNWAAAHTFYGQEVICWSTTAAYYSVIHGIRTLFSFIEFVLDQTRRKNLKKILKTHRKLCMFLLGLSSSKREIELRRLCINCFGNIFADTGWDSFLRSLGEKLSREYGNYKHIRIRQKIFSLLPLCSLQSLYSIGFSHYRTHVTSRFILIHIHVHRGISTSRISFELHRDKQNHSFG